MAEKRVSDHEILIVADHPREGGIAQLTAALMRDRAHYLTALRVSDCAATCNTAAIARPEPARPADRGFYPRTFGRRR